MKRITLLLLIVHACFLCNAQFTWTWLKGTKGTPKFGSYGTRGVADTGNVPGFRTGESTWTDSVGNVWMFGGRGNSRNATGLLNDLWKFNKATGTWAWISGDQDVNQFGTYGQKGIPAASNTVRSRAYANTWMDTNGNLWLYGGEGYDNYTVNTPPIYLSDLWKFDIRGSVWTWMGGDTTYKFRTVYLPVWGTKGVGTSSVSPGSKIYSSTWSDKDNNLWLFGGQNIGVSEFAVTNGLWKYSITTSLWTWVSGESTGSQEGNYGTKGVAAPSNVPCAREMAKSWANANGDLFVFGGRYRESPYPTRYLNDTWQYSTKTGLWTWLSGNISTPPNPINPLNPLPDYGVKGIASANTQPGARAGSVKWVDSAGNMWLYGGMRNTGYYNDIWKFSPATNLWTWIQGEQGTLTAPARYGVRGVFSAGNLPASALNYSSWTDNNLFYLRSSNQIWTFDPGANQWAWSGGDTSAAVNLFPTRSYVAGQKNVFAPENKPENRSYASTWIDNSNTLWMFGGISYVGSALLGDLWKYSPVLNQWAWVGGDTSLGGSTVYGQQGVASDLSKPGPRQTSTTWTDRNGNLWMFSGSGNELWKYSVATSQWTWMGGNSSGTAVFGTVGVPSSGNIPAATNNRAIWKDNEENVWLYGAGGIVYSDLLWRYNMTTNQWTWMAGFQNPLAAGGIRWGTKGQPDGRVNGRLGASSWVDTSGNFWLFGGTSFIGSISERENNNDLWKYSPAAKTWTWMAGDNVTRKKGVYGSKGLSTSSTNPGARRDAKAFTDGNNNLYLFGGTFDTTASSTMARYNDLWKYSVTDNRWTWLGGDSTLNHWGEYGLPLRPSAQNKPGGREGSASWSTETGKLWIFSGYGNAENGERALDDMMMFDPEAGAALPVTFQGFQAYRKNDFVQLDWSTSQEFNARSFRVERSKDGQRFNEIGLVSATGNSTQTQSYSFTDINPLAGNNYYRLREVDIDNRVMFSEIRLVGMADSKSSFNIAGNPVKNQLKLNFYMPSSKQTRIGIRNATGQLLKEGVYQLEKGSSTINIQMSGLAKGMYVVVVSSDNFQESKSFLLR